MEDPQVHSCKSSVWSKSVQADAGGPGGSGVGKGGGARRPAAAAGRFNRLLSKYTLVADNNCQSLVLIIGISLV